MALDQNSLKKILKESIEKFYTEKSSLVEFSGMEQACVFRIGIYLQE